MGNYDTLLGWHKDPLQTWSQNECGVLASVFGQTIFQSQDFEGPDMRNVIVFWLLIISLLLQGLPPVDL